MDSKDRNALLEALKDPTITLEEFKRYGAHAKKKQLELFDKYRFPIKHVDRYAENELSYRKLYFNMPRRRTYENKGIQRIFYEHSIPFTICNPGSANLSYRGPTNVGQRVRQASFVVYNITKKSGDGGGVTSTDAHCEQDSVYQGQSDFDIRIRRWVCDEKDDVYEQNHRE
uniref:Uncharacterized protein n=1 Tax=Lygus hesperus TaxID=30085 RepID=A0A146L2G7_LYGHE